MTIDYPEEKRYRLDYDITEREAGVWEDFLKHYKEVVTDVFVDYHRKHLDETITGLYAHQLSLWSVVEDARSMGDAHPLLFLFDTENYIPDREMTYMQVYQSLMYYRSLDVGNLDKFHTTVYFDPVPVKVDISEECHALLTMTYPTIESELGGFRVTIVSGNDIPGVNVIRKHIDLPFTEFLKSKEETSLKVVEFIATCVKEVDSKSSVTLYTSK